MDGNSYVIDAVQVWRFLTTRPRTYKVRTPWIISQSIPATHAFRVPHAFYLFWFTTV